MSTAVPKANSNNIYRRLKQFGINQIPQERKQPASAFKE
jgi:hypothetical protein